MARPAVDQPAFVGGELVDTGKWIARENPARTDELVGRVADCDVGLAERAATVAGTAFVRWSESPLAERSALLEAAVGGALEQVDGLSRLLSRELGKVLDEARGEISFARAFTEHCIARAPELLADRDVDDERGRLLVRKVPYGVVAAITPWNAPVILSMLKLVPALLTGNTLVVKPSPLVPLTATGLLSAIAAQLPAGVLNVVTGGAAVGDALVRHPAVRRVAFTGGSGVARLIAAASADGVKPLIMELGGNDAAILLRDVDLSDAAIERLIFGTFVTAGQVCMAAKRIYVHESRANELLERYTEVASRVLRMGDPFGPDTTMGPMVSLAQRDRVVAMVSQARDAGARILELGQVEAGLSPDSGYWQPPVLVVGLPDDARLVCEEQFGPAVPMMTFQDEDEVVSRANADPYGLGSSVWSVDEEHAFELGRRLQAGFTFINTHNRSGLTLRAPFGGRKASGFGREFGDEGILEYAQTHAIHAPAAARGGSLAGNAYPA